MSPHARLMTYELIRTESPWPAWPPTAPRSPSWKAHRTASPCSCRQMPTPRWRLPWSLSSQKSAARASRSPA
eukprot:12851669-Heterocapsa_arctica.AAC.1